MHSNLTIKAAKLQNVSTGLVSLDSQRFIQDLHTFIGYIQMTNTSKRQISNHPPLCSTHLDMSCTGLLNVLYHICIYINKRSRDIYIYSYLITEKKFKKKPHFSNNNHCYLRTLTNIYWKMISEHNDNRGKTETIVTFKKSKY